MASLRDIAEQLGVSTRTVSRVLNTNGYASPEVRKKVLDLAQRLEYSPNRAAQSLKRQKSMDVLVLTWSIGEQHMRRIQALEAVLREQDYQLSIMFGARPRQPSDADDLIRKAVFRRPAAIVAFAAWAGNDRHGAKNIVESRIPYVLLGSTDPRFDSIQVDFRGAMLNAVSYLASQGRKRIAYLGHAQPANNRNRIYWDSFRQGMKAVGQEPLQIQANDQVEPFESGRLAAREIARAKPRIDAVQAFSDLMALGLLSGLHDLGVRVPEDIAIIGIGDTQAGQCSWPQLTTVRFPEEDVGQASAQVILAKLSKAPAPAEGWSRVLPCSLQVRGTA